MGFLMKQFHNTVKNLTNKFLQKMFFNFLVCMKGSTTMLTGKVKINRKYLCKIDHRVLSMLYLLNHSRAPTIEEGGGVGCPFHSFCTIF